MNANNQIYIDAMDFVRTREDHIIATVKMERVLPTQKKSNVWPPAAKDIFLF
jgi:hypothetical protein